MEKVKTQFGDVDLPALVELYETKQRKAKEKSDWLKTEEGKAYNRLKAKEFYERNREKVLARMKAKYQEKGDVINERNKAAYHRRKNETTEA